MAAATAVIAPFTYNGSDYNTFKSDGTSGLTFDVITDSRVVVAQHILRRWIVEQGQLDIESIGVGLYKWLNGTLLVSQYDELLALLRSQALDVDGVDGLTLTASQTPIAGGGIQLTISARITLTRKLGGQTFGTVFELTPGNARLIVEALIT